MPKINQEEYEALKGLDDKWKWIARDEGRGLYAFTEKPVRKYDPSPYWDTETEGPYSALELIDEIHLFQFIQWEDEEPYNIQELIEEYEIKELRLAPPGTVILESEETEMKKDLKWLKENIKEEHEYNRAEHNKGGSEGFAHREFAFKYVLGLIDQLDEPEVLSPEWIEEHEYIRMDPDNPFVYVKDLQNLLVPKQAEADQAYKDGYEKGKQHTFYKGYLEGLADRGGEPETVADVVTTFWKSYERLKEVMSMEVEELEE